MKKALLCLLTVYISVPVFLYLFPYSTDLSRPQDVLNHTCNFYLNTEEDVSVGVWHTLPVSQWEASAGRTLDWYHETLGDGSPVIIYLHGNVGTRWDSSSRVLSAAGYHVLSLDYRGFGDSTGEPSEAGLTSDALYLYQWVKTRSRSLVCFWGHSLGSGVATNAAVKLQQQDKDPFESIKNLLNLYSLSLKKLTSPLLILHSEDDRVVPLHMGQKVWRLFFCSRFPAANVFIFFADFLFIASSCTRFPCKPTGNRTLRLKWSPTAHISDSPTAAFTWTHICQTWFSE
uniref:Abhydrolase domain containing 12B n=1 Tax=Nothobranchius furzeri TaxID=105023 RepID=A0A8C6MA58_NOTFU